MIANFKRKSKRRFSHSKRRACRRLSRGVKFFPAGCSSNSLYLSQTVPAACPTEAGKKYKLQPSREEVTDCSDSLQPEQAREGDLSRSRGKGAIFLAISLAGQGLQKMCVILAHEHRYGEAVF